MNLLIAGGAGFIGANFAHRAIAKGHSIVIIDKMTYAASPKNISSLSVRRSKFYEGSICDDAALTEVMELGVNGKRFDACINFAAESHVDRSIANAVPFVESNVVGAVKLVEYARRAKIPVFMQVSTDEVYGSVPPGEASLPNSRLRPSNAYAASKAAADHLVYSYYQTHRYDVRITRCTNNFGRFQHPEKFIPTVILSAIERSRIPIYGDGAQIRDWIHVDDHCDGIFAVLERGRAGQIYHFGSILSQTADAGISNVDLVQKILKMLAKKIGVTPAKLNGLVEHVSDRPGHDRRYALDWAITEKELRWKPQVSLEQGLDRTLDWYVENKDWWKDTPAMKKAENVNAA